MHRVTRSTLDFGSSSSSARVYYCSLSYACDLFQVLPTPFVVISTTNTARANFFFGRTFDLDFAMGAVCACAKGCGLSVFATGAAAADGICTLNLVELPTPDRTSDRLFHRHSQ